jgi:hypothetical protein
VVLRNLRALVEAKRKLGRLTPAIAWHFLAFEHNAHEIPQALEMARQLGVNHFASLTPFDVSWDDPNIRIAAVEPITAEIGMDGETAMAGNLDSFLGGLNRAAIDREFDVRWTEKPGVLEMAARLEAARSPLTCHWLYKSMSMDSKGRVFPCCGAPSPDRDLVFSQFDGGAGPDPYNSGKYRQSRLFFANPEQYRRGRESGSAEQEPYCVRCEWQKTTPNADIAQIRRFLKDAAGDLFSAESADLLSSW